MEEKKGLGQMLSEFFAGKGFYIVLLLSAALIATSIWLMASGSRADVAADSGEETNVPAARSGVPEANDPAREAVPAMNETPRINTGRRSGALMEPIPEDETETIRPEAPAVEQQPAPIQGTAAIPTFTEPEADYFIWPVNGTLQRAFSMETLSYDPTMGDWRVHSGWDIAAPEGTQVLATANGTVSAVYRDQWLGSVVEVRHSNGLVSVYANLADEPAVSVGQSVRVGAVLGKVGNTALGEVGEVSHVHFALRKDAENVDPSDWLPQP